MRTDAVDPAKPKMNSTLGRKTAAIKAVPASTRADIAWWLISCLIEERGQLLSVWLLS